jgi:glycosyltransferase involved in cell wall biosynthesis
MIADDPEKFAETIRRLLKDPGLRRELGDAGRELYLKRFSWSTAWKRLRDAGL